MAARATTGSVLGDSKARLGWLLTLGAVAWSLGIYQILDLSLRFPIAGTAVR